MDKMRHALCQVKCIPRHYANCRKHYAPNTLSILEVVLAPPGNLNLREDRRTRLASGKHQLSGRRNLGHHEPPLGCNDFSKHLIVIDLLETPNQRFVDNRRNAKRNGGNMTTVVPPPLLSDAHYSFAMILELNIPHRPAITIQPNR